MRSVLAVVLTVAVAAAGVVETNDNMDSIDNQLIDTELVQAFVVFRHGDRTPDLEELELLATAPDYHKAFFPYGTKALTNRGKRCGYKVGQYLRQRYGELISELYMPNQTVVRTTDFARTKMTVLTALAALYPPPPAQRWHPSLDWQPVSYDTLPYEEDDLLYWYNCPRYLWLRNTIYELPKVKEEVQKFRNLFQYLSEKTGKNITTTENVFYLDNLFQTLNNVNLTIPEWAEKVMPQIKKATIEEYKFELYNSELIKLAAGVMMNEIVNASRAVMQGAALPRLWLYSAHENNVAAAMAAARVFYPHQPSYGSTFSLELRKNRSTGRYGVMAVYVADPCSTSSFIEQVLSIDGCGGTQMCDFDRFEDLVKEHMWSNDEFKQQCDLKE